ncbi:MAG: hypothetical protein DI598_06185 [Pseudopedobacter saltans]|uniref:Right handed beta helix domain-containing protein n=1 Tax=Pseudopedobacter saltans TaxID=151895 RepID=A0A2W5F923_9SPHI|nr:MAG: hypothetical protein DI598_06185 [Pseudopedobacter saltans]
MVLVFFACKKTDYIGSPDASISALDSVKFDTVFTAQGSATRIFKIFNNNKQKLRISNIQLAGGSNSAYQMNVNGNAGVDFSNIDIEAGDSIYCFVRVNIDPTNASSPFIVQDSIGIFYNGNSKYVQLQAYGQNAVYLTNESILNDTIWKNTLPIVLLKKLTIPEGKTLTIEKGSDIYCHGGAGLSIEGTLLANGDTANANRINFTTDRMDYVNNVTNSGGVSYKNLAGAWLGIDFGPKSTGNILNYVTVKNAIYGITDTLNTTVPTTTKLNLQGCIVQNNSGYGVLSRLGSMTISNSLIVNNGSSVGLYNGGNYLLNYNTLAGYSNVYVSHNNPVLYLGGSSDATFNVSINNTILWGDNTSLVNEIGIGNNFGGNNIQIKVDHSLAKYTALPSVIVLSNMLQNDDPGFLLTDNNEVQYDFHLANASPCIGAATPINGISYDLSGNKRNTLNPSIGCYESL